MVMLKASRRLRRALGKRGCQSPGFRFQFGARRGRAIEFAGHRLHFKIASQRCCAPGFKQRRRTLERVCGATEACGISSGQRLANLTQQFGAFFKEHAGEFLQRFFL